MQSNRGRLPQNRAKKRGRPRCHSAPAIINSTIVHKARRKRWSNENMIAALEAVKKGTPVLRAALMYEIPKQTLYDRVNGRVKHGTLPGPKPYLSKREESELAEFIVSVAAKGYGKTRQQIKGIAENCAHEKGVLSKEKRISDGWFNRFMDRQSHLSLRRGDATAAVRMDCVSKESMDSYFQLLKGVLDEHGLSDNPSCIYNVDETGMPLEPRPPKIVTVRGQKKVRVRTSGNKAQITVVVSVSATGNTIPPFVIFDAKNVNIEWTRGEVPGTAYAANSSGWIDSNLFKQWLCKHFLKHAVSTRPLLLLLDGHCSHYQPELIRFAKANDIILFCLPPHTTHVTQPLDVSVFKPLKVNWQECCHKFLQEYPGRVVTKYQFSELFNQAWSMSMTPGNICVGFKKCGIYPFDPQAIIIDGEEDGRIDTEKCSASTDGIELSDRSKSFGNGKGQPSHNLEEIDFSPEQMELYQRRYDEEYDIPDPQYLRWKEIYYPDEHPGKNCNDWELEKSLAQEFSYIEPCSPVAVLDTTCEVEEPLEEPSLASHDTNNAPTSMIEPVSETSVDSLQQSSSSVTASMPEPFCEASADRFQQSSSSVAVLNAPEERNELKHISKFLIQYVPSKGKTNPSQAAKRVSGAKILTSTECAAIIEEREKNKKIKEQEKDERKAKREEKRKEKEDVAKKKAEQKQSKQKAGTQSKIQSRKRQSSSKVNLASKKSQTRKEKSNRTSVEETSGSSFNDSNECCVCFRTYEEDEEECTGLEWVQCVCTRWIHEECVSEIISDDQGRELLCPFCVV